MNKDKPEDNTEQTASCSGHVEPVVMCTDIESIIDKIQNADEIEIMEFDFGECFAALREYKKLKEQAEIVVGTNYFKCAVFTFEQELKKAKYT